MKLPVNEQIRVSDNDAGHPAASATSPNFQVDYWSVRWNVRDFTLGSDLGNLEAIINYTKPDGTKAGVYGDTGLQSAFRVSLPNGPLVQIGASTKVTLFKATWERPGYFTQVLSFPSEGVCTDLQNRPSGDPGFTPPTATWCDTVDMEFMIFMESTVIHNNKAISQFAYDPETNTFTVDAWLERDGSIFPAVTEGKVEIYGDNDTLIATLDAPCTLDHATHPHSGISNFTTQCPKGPDERGVFRQFWLFEDASGNPLPAKTYKVVTYVTMVSGALLTNPSLLDTRHLVGTGGSGGGTSAGNTASRFVYDPVAKNFTVDSWLVLDGKVVTSVDKAVVTISDADSGVVVTTPSLTSTTHDAQGLFRQTWPFEDGGGTPLPATSYKVVTTITTDAGTTFEGIDILDARTQVAVGENLGVTLPGNAPDLGTEIETAKQDILSEIGTAKGEIKSDIADVKQDTTDIKTATEVTIPGKLDTLQSGVTAILEDTSTTIPQQLTSIETELKAGLKAKILNRPTTVKRGNTITIQFQSESGLSPVLNLYDPSNFQRVINAAMTEIGTTGIYKYNLTVDSTWPLGDYTVMVTESVNGSLVSMVLTVALTDIPTIGTDVCHGHLRGYLHHHSPAAHLH